ELEEEDSLPLPEALGQALNDQREHRTKLENGAQRLQFLERLPEMPDDNPVSGDDAWGCFQDLSEALPEDSEVADMDDRDVLSEIGLREDGLDEPLDWAGWTAGMVREGLKVLAKVANRTPDKLLARAIEQGRKNQEAQREAVKAIDQKVKDLR